MAKITNYIKRGSFNQQDIEGTTSKMALQARPPRSNIPKELLVRPVLPSVIKPLIIDFHYLHSMPAAARLCFGVYLGEELAGAVVFTSGPRHGYKLLSACKPQDVSVLARLWLSDTLPKNSESRVIGIALRYLRKHTTWKLIISYADPVAGHSGTIYRASGWLYLGMTLPGSHIVLPDGTRLHSRTCGNRFGTGSIRHLRATGVAAIRQAEPGKHKYIYLLNPSWRFRLKEPLAPYPKGAA